MLVRGPEPIGDIKLSRSLSPTPGWDGTFFFLASPVAQLVWGTTGVGGIGI